MAPKRALVVDDSKSARVILSRMLEKYDIEVDMAESAEQAIEYLEKERPDAIFMDHLMPGMDGLEAVKVIKANPLTAMIPIMMYTSQEGELYVGQARALGAMGVLPKQVRPVDVSKVLYDLHLLPERRDGDVAALAPVDLEAAPAEVVGTAAAPAAPVGAEWAGRVETTVKNQGAELRRFIVASLDSFSTRIVTDVRGAIPAPKVASELQPVAGAASAQRRVVLQTVTAVAAGAALVFGVLWMTARGDLVKARSEAAALAAANAELTRSRQELADSVKELSNALATGPVVTPSAATPAAAGPAGSAAPAGPAPANPGPPRIEPVPYGEMPLDRGRLDALRELLSKLEAQHAHGVVRITSAAGLFCLTGNPTDGYLPATPSLLASKCDLIGNPAEDSSFAMQRQSLAFANLVSGVRQRTGAALSVAIESGSNARPLMAYPARSEALTAGEWNKAASANNRVEIGFEPAP